MSCPRNTPGCWGTDCSPAPGHSCTGPNAPGHVDMFDKRERRRVIIDPQLDALGRYWGQPAEPLLPPTQGAQRADLGLGIAKTLGGLILVLFALYGWLVALFAVAISPVLTFVLLELWAIIYIAAGIAGPWPRDRW